MRVYYMSVTVLLLISIVGITSTFAIRIGRAVDLLPSPRNASSDIEFSRAQSLTDASNGITEICWPAYWLLLGIYWLLKSYSGVKFDWRVDIPFLLPIIVSMLLTTDTFGLRGWMWG